MPACHAGGREFESRPDRKKRKSLRPALFSFMKTKIRINPQLWIQAVFVLLVWMMLYSVLGVENAVVHEKERQAEEAKLVNLADSLVNIVFIGDIMGHQPQFQVAYNRETGQYEYADCFRYVAPCLQSADLACGNLEVTLGGPPYAGYPCFSSPDALLFSLVDAGFDVLFTANNHVLDRGKSGVERTIQMLDSVAIPHAGSYVDSISRDTSYPLIVGVKGMKVGFINATYGTNGLQVKAPNIINMLDTVEMARDLARLSELGADLKVAVVHWGNEYQLKADACQRRCAESLARHGADLIIGGHPHVVQDADTVFGVNGNPVVVYYSMGNFISNQRKPNTYCGIMVMATVNRFTHRVVAADYIPYYVHKGSINGKYQYYVVPTKAYLEGQFDFHLSPHDSLTLVGAQNAMTERLSNFHQWSE